MFMRISGEVLRLPPEPPPLLPGMFVILGVLLASVPDRHLLCVQRAAPNGTAAIYVSGRPVVGYTCWAGPYWFHGTTKHNIL